VAYELSNQQRKAAVLWADGRMYNEIAEAIGVDPSTVWRWTKLPAFKLEAEDILKRILAATERERIQARRAALHRLKGIAERENEDRDDDKLSISAAREIRQY